MAYSRPTYKRRAPARKYQTKSKSVYKKVMKSTRSALPALARQVATLSKKVRGTTSEVQYSANAVNPIGNVGGTNLYILPLSQFAGWSRTFGTDADDESNHRALWKKSNFEFKIETNGERANVDYTMYVVSLTRQGMEELFTPSSGGLAGPLGITPPQNTVHYSIGGTYGMSFLNRNYFNIHFCRRFITGTTGSTATDVQDLRKRWYYKLAHNGGKGHIIKNNKGDWKAQPSPQLAGQNYYVMIFNNDSTADQSVQFYLNAIHTLQIS